MVRLKFLLIVTATSIALLYPTEVAFAGARTIACTAIAGALYACPDPPETGGKANGGSVDVTADTTTGSSGTGISSHPRRGRGGTDTLAPPRVCANGDPAKPGIDTIPCGNGSFLPFARPNTPTTPCTVCSPSTIVSVSDLQNFPAYAAPTNMEPNGWTIVGLPTNFWADPSAQIQEGLLLGQPAHVMFTPIGYHWDYGDSNTTSTPTSGSNWKNLNLAEFSNTTTSHTYATKGTYTVVLTIDYRADYSFGDQGWRPVEGIVTVPSAPFTVMAAKESTVLVAQDCNTNPRGPGC